MTAECAAACVRAMLGEPRAMPDEGDGGDDGNVLVVAAGGKSVFPLPTTGKMLHDVVKVTI